MVLGFRTQKKGGGGGEVFDCVPLWEGTCLRCEELSN